jgi:hypothetical protein
MDIDAAGLGLQIPALYRSEQQEKRGTPREVHLLHVVS